MKVRPAASQLLLEESLDQTEDIKTHAQLMDHLQKHYAHWNPTEENVTIKKYYRDDRIGWDTYLICVDGHAALFSDGPLKEEEEAMADTKGPSAQELETYRSAFGDLTDKQLSPKSGETYRTASEELKVQQEEAYIQERNEFVRKAVIYYGANRPQCTVRDAWSLAIQLWDGKPEGF